MPRARLLRLLPLLTLGCSLVAGFDDFTGKSDENAEAGGAGEGASGASSGNPGQAGANAVTGGAATANGGAGATSAAGATGGSGGTSDSGGTSGSDGVGGSGASGGSMGAAGAEGGSDSVGGADSGGATGGSGAGGAGQGGSNATGGSGGFSGEASCGELLVNGDFDLGGTAGWSEFVSYSSSLRIVTHRDDTALLAEEVAPVSGEFLAWLGGIPDNETTKHVSRLHQLVRIPARTTRLRFSGWLWIETLEPDEDELYDLAYAQMVEVDSGPSDSTVIHQFVEWSDHDSGTGWAAFDFDTTSLDRLRERTLTLEVYSRTDLTFKTNFWLDSLSLFAECER